MTRNRDRVEVVVAPTAAQVEAARGWVRACVEYRYGAADESKLAALDDTEVVRRAMDYWPDGWADFCNHFDPANRPSTTTQSALATEKGTNCHER